MKKRPTAMAALLAVGCGFGPLAPRPPAAEFLVSSSAATYWVQSASHGFRIRQSPLILARAGGKFYEVYVAEVDRSYTDAVFTGERVYRRDIASGDSTVIFEDTAVVRRSAAFQRAHPEMQSIPPDADTDDDVAYAVEGETDILNVLGPYVAIEHRLSIDRGSASSDDTARAVIDIRTGALADPSLVARDAALHQAAGERSGSGRRWHSDNYDVLVRPDAAHGLQTVLVTNHLGREWLLGEIKSPIVQIFWLDNPRITAPLRQSLTRAFNEATAYGEPVQLASRPSALRRLRSPLSLPRT